MQVKISPGVSSYEAILECQTFWDAQVEAKDMDS